MTNQLLRSRIRRIFLSGRPSFALLIAAELLGRTLTELRRDIQDGVIVAVSTPLGERVTREELIAVAMQSWEQAVIENALGDDASKVLPEAVRLVELRARIPRYQHEMLRYLAVRDRTTVDHVLSRELDGIASIHSQELAAVLPEFGPALAWPESIAESINLTC